MDEKMETLHRVLLVLGVVTESGIVSKTRLYSSLEELLQDNPDYSEDRDDRKLLKIEFIDQ